MKHFIISVDGKLVTVYSKTGKEARFKALSSHPGAYNVKVIGAVDEMYALLKPFIEAGICTNQ